MSIFTQIPIFKSLGRFLTGTGKNRPIHAGLSETRKTHVDSFRKTLVDDEFSVLDDEVIQMALDEILAGSDDLPEEAGARPDRVVVKALENGLVTREDIAAASSGTSDAPWRSLAEFYPERSTSIYRLAASVYGFAPVLVCEMGTLVQADMLTKSVPESIWQSCFDLGAVPAVPHGSKPSLGSDMVLASYDPSRRALRNFANNGPLAPCRLRYADKKDVLAIQRVLIERVPFIRRAVKRSAYESLRIVEPEDQHGLRRAA